MPGGSNWDERTDLTPPFYFTQEGMLTFSPRLRNISVLYGRAFVPHSSLGGVALTIEFHFGRPAGKKMNFLSRYLPRHEEDIVKILVVIQDFNILSSFLRLAPIYAHNIKIWHSLFLPV